MFTSERPHVGFTGTRQGMTVPQKEQFWLILHGYGHIHFHHGDCVGADAEAHDIVSCTGCVRLIHPPEDDKLRAFKDGIIVSTPRPYMERNRAIVDSCNELIACPSTNVEQRRSGTWATIRYAIRKQKPITIIYPSGELSPKQIRKELKSG